MTTKGTALTQEQKMARVLTLLEEMFDGQSGFETFKSRFDAVANTVDELKGLNFGTVREEVEKLKAKQEEIVGAIRSSRRSPGYFPGIEDECKNFNLLDYFRAKKFGDEKYAPRECELARESLKAIQAKGQNVGDWTMGGSFVADQYIADIIEAIYSRSVLINLEGSEGESRMSLLDGLTGATHRVPKMENGLTAYWIGEEDEYAETSAKTGDETITPHKLGILVKITDSMLKMGGFGFDQMLRRDMVRAMSKKLDWSAIFGTGGASSTGDRKMPRGLIYNRGIKVWKTGTGVLTYDAALATTFGGGSHTFDTLMDMQLAVEEDEIEIEPEFAWISSPRYFHLLRQLKITNFSGQTAGQPYLLGSPMLSWQRLKDLIGDYGKSTQFKNTNLPGAGVFPNANSNAKFTVVAGGNWSQGVFARYFGMDFEDDAGKGKGFTSDHTYLKGRMYGDFFYRQPRAFIVAPDAQVIP